MTKLLEDLIFFVADVTNNGQDVLDVVITKPNRERQKLMREQNILAQVSCLTRHICIFYVLSYGIRELFVSVMPCCVTSDTYTRISAPGGFKCESCFCGVVHAQRHSQRDCQGVQRCGCLLKGGLRGDPPWRLLIEFRPSLPPDQVLPPSEGQCQLQLGRCWGDADEPA